MRKLIAFIFAIGLFAACKEEHSDTKEQEKIQQENSTALTFTTVSITASDFEQCKVKECPKVQVSFLKAEGNLPVTSALNKKNQEHLIKIFNSSEDQAEANTIEDAVKRFIEDYFNFKKEFPESPAGYEAEVSQKVLSKTDSIIVLETNFYLFTGGAHGYGATRFLNFDAQTGRFLTQQDLIKDKVAFTNYVEQKFREKYNIPAGENINSKGFFFENDEFSLPENIAVTKDKVLLVYNRYEAASYAQGELKLMLSKEEVANWLNY